MPLLTVLTLVSLAILVWLGNWQYGRYADKKANPPEQVSAEFNEITVQIDRSNPGRVQQLNGIVGGEAVWRRYAPARIEGEDGLVLALVDATSGVHPVPMAVADVEDFTRRSNVFIRPAKTGGIARSNQPENDIWYGFDGTAMLRQLGYQQENVKVVEPDQITIRLAEDSSRARKAENPYATLQVRDALPPERHFGYALTWWGMAMALIGVYLAFHHAQGRLRFRG
ncbi:SURF1 family cytochrome oxidase biogenesis protein [Henriciella sp. AS95]|uniref:SURF1 family cytochrome oxidase biogenesis protein n=1 Tax=Henriciella sp. AS95 TaxID=3135782 RepID=UPI00316CAF5B